MRVILFGDVPGVPQLVRHLPACNVAAVVGAGFFLLQYVVSRGRWIGGGDIRIGAMMGMMLGFPPSHYVSH